MSKRSDSEIKDFIKELNFHKYDVKDMGDISVILLKKGIFSRVEHSISENKQNDTLKFTLNGATYGFSFHKEKDQPFAPVDWDIQKKFIIGCLEKELTNE